MEKPCQAADSFHSNVYIDQQWMSWLDRKKKSFNPNSFQRILLEKTCTSFCLTLRLGHCIQSKATQRWEFRKAIAVAL